MRHNIIISYDLYKQGQNYETLATEIKKLGGWAKVNLSLWYVNTTLTSGEVVQRLRTLLDSNDKLFVVDATSNEASWYNITDEVSKHLQESWNTAK